MNDIEKRARELLAGEYLKCGHKGTARAIELGAWPKAATPALRAIIAALSAAPQGGLEPAAFCEPDNPFNGTAFAWPGTAREARHSLPLYAVQQSAAPQVPEGWVLVPEKITDEMTIAFAETWFSKPRPIDDMEMDDCYEAMLAAGFVTTDEYLEEV